MKARVCLRNVFGYFVSEKQSFKTWVSAAMVLSTYSNKKYQISNISSTNIKK